MSSVNRTYFLSAVLCLSILGCTSENPRVATKLNDGAALNGDLPVNPFQWKIITSAANKQDSTMYTLFGNDIAVRYARTHTQRDYPNGSVLSLLTWSQQEDPRWFGGKIPSAPKSVEFVTVGIDSDQKPSYSYQNFEGAPLKKVTSQEAAAPEGRMTYLINQRAAVMP